MSNKIAEKLADIKYDEQITLAIVEGDEDLRSIFIDETQISSFVLLRTLSKENQLKEETQSFLRMIFDQIILTKQSLIDKYIQLTRLNDGANDGAIECITIPEKSIVSTEIEVKPVKVKDVFKGVKEQKLPRRHGKEKILKDIEAQGGKATPLQNAMLKVNLMKNTYVNLNARLIKDMFLTERILTDEDYRTINSVITIMERKLESILAKKK